MATLQKIRSKGPLLVIIIGLALFAFIAGDAWKILQPHQSHDVGEINGDALSVQEYQALVEEYADIYKMSSGQQSLTEEQMSQVKDEVWRNYVNNKLIADEAKKLGLTVSKAEVLAIIDAGVNPLLQQTPFRNPQTGAFDKDMLKKFLSDYDKMSKSQMSVQYADYYASLFKYWTFIEKNLIQSTLAAKYQAIITNSILANSVEAQDAFNARIDQSNVLLAAVPYFSVPDSTISVKESDLKELYNKKKEQFRQYVETRDIKFIDVQIAASPEDRAEIENEVAEYTETLKFTADDYNSFIRTSGSEVPYVDMYYNASAFPRDIATRIDTSKVGTTYGPYYNAADNTINSYKVVAKKAGADSIEYRQIQVMAETPARSKELSDSIYNAIRGGASFTEVANRYGQTGENVWLTSAQYEGALLDGDNLKYVSTIHEMGPGDLNNLAIGQGNVILQVTKKQNHTDKYKVAVIKRPVVFSADTYNREYNKFSQFIASNPSLEQLQANAEESGYRLLERDDLSSAEAGIGGVKNTKEALRWAFGAKAGEVSGLYECGDNDRLLVVALSRITPEGYRPLRQVQDQLRAEIVKDKKAAKIIADMKAANYTSFDQYKNMANITTDSIKHVTFAAPAYVSVLRSSEPMVSAYASVAPMNKLSAPIQGNAGVYVLQVYEQDKLDETFDASVEENRIENMYSRYAARIMNDLYMKGSVVDTRYLYF